MTGGSWFHASKTIIKRSAGRSVVAAAAYRTGSSLTCERERTTHDYTRKRGVAEVFTTTPEGHDGLQWTADIPQLVNAMERSEKRKDAQLGHEWTIALPAELDDAQRSTLSHAMAQQLSDLYGVAVIGAVHRPGREGDERNHHVHLLFTTRQVEADGKLGAKVTVLTGLKTGPEEVKRFRAIAADLINDALEDAGSGERVSPLSFEARGIDRIPSEHLGPSASEMERRDPGSSDRGDMNRQIAAHNRTLDTLVEELAALDAEIARAEEQRLDARYGPLEPEIPAPLPPPEPEPIRPAETMEALFEAAIAPAIDALHRPEAADMPRDPAPPERTLQQTLAAWFDAALRPVIALLKATGETWKGARDWQHAADAEPRRREWKSDERETPELAPHRRGFWERLVRPRPEPRERDGPER